jgi:hypothetical protein
MEQCRFGDKNGYLTPTHSVQAQKEGYVAVIQTLLQHRQRQRWL